MRKSITSFVLVIFAFLLTSCYLPASPEPNTNTTTLTTCKLNLQVFVRQGPDVNYDIGGQISFTENYNPYQGDLLKNDGQTSHPISLSWDGRAVHFILETERGHIFGTGMMESDIYTCSGSGGGTQSGPALGDLGDWRGEWVRETNTVQVEVKPTSLFNPTIFIIAVIAVALGMGIAFLLWVSRPFKTNIKPTNTNIKRINPNRSELAHISEYLVTYTADDKLFDLSFQIEKGPQYFGECGVTIAKTLDATSTKATAFEVWVFEAGSSQSALMILMSDFCNSQESLRNEMQQRGQASAIHASETLTLQTTGLKVTAKILEIDYTTNTPYPGSVFKKVVMKLDVWKI